MVFDFLFPPPCPRLRGGVPCKIYGVEECKGYAGRTADNYYLCKIDKKKNRCINGTRCKLPHRSVRKQTLREIIFGKDNPPTNFAGNTRKNRQHKKRMHKKHTNKKHHHKNRPHKKRPHKKRTRKATR